MACSLEWWLLWTTSWSFEGHRGEAYGIASLVLWLSFLCRAVNMDACRVLLTSPLLSCNVPPLLPEVIPFMHGPAWTTKATASVGGWSSSSRTFHVDRLSISCDELTATPAKAAALVEGGPVFILSLLGHSHFQWPFWLQILHVLSAILCANEGRRWNEEWPPFEPLPCPCPFLFVDYCSKSLLTWPWTKGDCEPQHRR